MGAEIKKSLKNQSTECFEWQMVPGRIQEAARTSGYSTFEGPLAPKCSPEGRRWDSVGVENSIENRKMSVERPP